MRKEDRVVTNPVQMDKQLASLWNQQERKGRDGVKKKGTRGKGGRRRGEERGAKTKRG